ncbi:MAG: DNA polymerase III subunit alpha, partial [Polyangiales bacterium]
MAEFVHLHVHSQYSMLDGAIRVKELVSRVKALGMKAVALTDHGNMHGAIDFYKKCKDADVQAILGCEVGIGYAFPGDKPDKNGRHRTYHLPMLARTVEGYRSLIALNSRSWTAPPLGCPPQADLDDLAALRKDIIVLTGCLGGLVPQALLQHGPDMARAVLARLKEVVEPGNLFVELQDHGLVEQPIVNRLLAEIAREMDLPLVATNNAHYLQRDDATAQRALMCIASGTTLDEAEAVSHGSEEMFLKSPDEMAEVFADYPEAIANTVRIAEMCKVKLKLGEPTLPRFRDEQGNDVPDVDEHFAELSRKGLAKRFETFKRQGKTVDEAKYKDRLEVEIGVIQRMKFPGYFLIVQDFINWGKQNGVPVGPGRGSGAGSIVAYALGITDIDPIPYDLLFERFLNPERVSMPDFDVDFCMIRREKVIDYVRQKYGRESVGQIATFQLLKSKSCVRDVGRMLGLSFQDTDAIAKLVPDPVQGKSVSIPEALEKEPRLKAMYDEQESTRAVLDLARKLENLNRHAGMHAAGIVISEGPLWDSVPVF